MIANTTAPAKRLSGLRPALFGAYLTPLTLVGGLLLGTAVGNVVFARLPAQLNEPLRIALAAISALAGMAIGGALWGLAMGRLAQSTQPRRMAWAGILGFVPITLLLGLMLQAIEPIAVAGLGAQIPLHRLFTLLFVPTAGLIAGAGGLALGIGLNNRRLAWRLALRAGLAAASAFLVVDIGMEVLGWQVGAPLMDDMEPTVLYIDVRRLTAAGQ